MYDFSGKVAFVTGAGQGLGRDFAQAFARYGARVIIADIDATAGARAVATIEAEGGRAVAVTCDVANEANVDQAVEAAVAAFGGVDILINNAGRHLPKSNRPFMVQSSDELRDLFDVNLMGVIFCTKACAKQMAIRGGGVVVNLSSIAGHFASTPYGVSKLAVRGLTIAFASELAKQNIRVNAVSPGLVATQSVLAEVSEEMISSFRDKHQLVARRGEMDDITQAVLFLCSTQSGFITGETLKVSAGYPLGI